jgi:hypothetical protein
LKSKNKFRELLSLTKHVAPRVDGLKDLTANFHVGTHVSQMMLWFGAATNTNMSTDESHHKADKKTARRTNKQPDTFYISIAKKQTERRAVELAMLDITEGKKRWQYYQPEEEVSMTTNSEDEIEPQLFGPKAKFYKPKEANSYVYKLESEMKGKHLFVYPEDVEKVINAICDEVKDDLNEVWAYSELRVHSDHNTLIYHACPFLQGAPWYDWAMIDLFFEDDSNNSHQVIPEYYSYMPCQLRAFVDLRELPTNTETSYEPTIYCIIEK